MDSEDFFAMALGIAAMLGIFILVSFFVFAAFDSLFDLHVLVIVALTLVTDLAITAGILWLLTTNDRPLSPAIGCTVMLAVFSSGVVVATAIVSSVFV